MPLSPLERKNVEHIVQEYQKDEAVLSRYSEKGFFSLGEALSWLSGEINSLEKELEQEDD